MRTAVALMVLALLFAPTVGFSEVAYAQSAQSDLEQYLDDVGTWGVNNTNVASDFTSAGYDSVTPESVANFANGACYDDARMAATIFSLNTLGIQFKDAGLVTELMGTVSQTCRVDHPGAIDDASNVFWSDMLTNTTVQRKPLPTRTTPAPVALPSNQNTKNTMIGLCAAGGAGAGAVVSDALKNNRAGRYAAMMGVAALSAFCPQLLD